MAKFQLTNKAVEDLAGIWEYTYDTWSERQANKYYALLLQACQEISNEPKMGKEYDEVVIGIMGYLAYRHIIMYKKISSKEILIVRILHCQMDLKSKNIE